MMTNSTTPITTESTLLRDIATAIEERQTNAAPCRTIPLTRQAAELFARINGWHWSFGYRFEPQDLGKYGNGSDYHRPYWCDHALYFWGRMDGKRGWVNIAIAGQPYQLSDSVRVELEELEGQGYCVHVPPGCERASIWFPGQTLFIVVTLPGVTVKWLPEQLETK